jgi:HTH-type transcriptional regulator/antitoxin HigA
MRQDLDKIRYEYAITRVGALLPLVGETTPADDPAAIELGIMSDYVISYEMEYFPIGRPTMAELIQLSLEEKGIIQNWS